MNERCFRNLEELKRARETVIQSVSGFSEAQIDFRKRPGKWSIGEILDHLVLSTEFFTEEVGELIRRARKAPSGKRVSLTRTFDDVDFSLPLMPRPVQRMVQIPMQIMSAFVPSPVRETFVRIPVFAAQSATRLEPRAGRSLQELEKDLKESVERLERLLQDNKNLDFSRLIHRHPFMGKNDIAALIRTTELHDRRHLDQIQALAEHSRFPEN